jgi:hypothetical protein
MLRTKILREFLDSLTDDFKIPDDRVEGFLVLPGMRLWKDCRYRP